jgi:hypothetical protein
VQTWTRCFRFIGLSIELGVVLPFRLCYPPVSNLCNSVAANEMPVVGFMARGGLRGGGYSRLDRQAQEMDGRGAKERGHVYSSLMSNNKQRMSDHRTAGNLEHNLQVI